MFDQKFIMALKDVKHVRFNHSGSVRIRFNYENIKVSCCYP